MQNARGAEACARLSLHGFSVAETGAAR